MTTTSAPVRVTAIEITTLLADYGATGPTHRDGTTRVWKVPAPTGGYLTVEIDLRPRWCSLGVDRWHTTDRDRAVAKPWFRQRVWPVVETAHKARRTGTGYLPSGNPTYTYASPIERTALLDVLRHWVEAELSW